MDDGQLLILTRELGYPLLSRPDPIYESDGEKADQCMLGELAPRVLVRTSEVRSRTRPSISISISPASPRNLDSKVDQGMGRYPIGLFRSYTLVAMFCWGFCIDVGGLVNE